MAKPGHQFVEWFRAASPYIHTHRGQTFVICFGGEVVEGEGFASLIHDIALLSSLGIRVVVVHGARAQVDRRLAQLGVTPQYRDGLRITDDVSLRCVKEASGTIRVEIEALFSTGITNSPMAGARIRVASGNFVTARPLGVRDGVDFHHTGSVRRVDVKAINARLDNGEITLISPIGYSPTGEAFNLSAMNVASAVAIALGAGKLVFLMRNDELTDPEGRPLRQLTQKQAEALIARNGRTAIPELVCGLEACSRGVKRVHLVDRQTDGALLLELFTRDGIGTLISAAPFDEQRKATIDDVAGILELIAPLENSGVLVRRSREKLEIEIGRFTVLVRDGAIIGCAALYPYAEESVAEIACLAVHPSYCREGRGELLLQSLEQEAVQNHITQLYVLTTQTAHWFVERGFAPARLENLPISRQGLYNYQRNSKVFVKVLGS